MEWAYYYQTPGLNIAPNAEGTGIQRQLLLLSLGDQCVGNLCVGLADYGLPFSCQKKQRVKFIGDYLGHYRGQPAGFLGASGRSDLLIATIGALTISLVITAATFTRGLTALIGVPNNFAVQAGVMLVAAVIFSFSSYIGIDHGMQRLSKWWDGALLVLPFWCF